VADGVVDMPDRGVVPRGSAELVAQDHEVSQLTLEDSSRHALAEQGLGGHHDLHLERHVRGGGLPGDAFDEGVGHDLPLATRVTARAGLVSGPHQRGVSRDSLDSGEQRGQVAHRVEGRAAR
jgi:hypothetical protein